MEEERAHSLAIKYLSRFNVTRKKLVDYLERKGFKRALAIKVASRLEKQGFLDDFDYARAYIRRKKEKFGSFRLQKELLRKGVPFQVVDRAISELDEEEEKKALKQIASDYLKKNLGLEGKRLKRKLASFLTRRGFCQEMVLAVLREVLGDDESFFSEK